jgi:hypothetical protein
VEVKRKAPQVHTVLEIIKSRWYVMHAVLCALCSMRCVCCAAVLCYRYLVLHA